MSVQVLAVSTLWDATIGSPNLGTKLPLWLVRKGYDGLKLSGAWLDRRFSG
jgi:hypothetical protein